MQHASPASRSTGAVRRRAARRRRPRDVRQGIRALREDVEDLGEPVEEITQFDQCMFTVGVAATRLPLPDRAGRRDPARALSFDMRGAPCRSDLMAFPGEEPPQIECNEDAGGVETDE